MIMQRAGAELPAVQAKPQGRAGGTFLHQTGQSGFLPAAGTVRTGEVAVPNPPVPQTARGFEPGHAGRSARAGLELQGV